MLRVSKLFKYFDEAAVLNCISFNLEPGNRVALVGFNGAGKTTLLRILAGLESYSNGHIETSPNVSIGYLPQEVTEYDSKTVEDFLEEYTEQSGDEFMRKVYVMFAGLTLPEITLSKKIKSLSSGQKTKVFLTALLLRNDSILLLDEPTNNLDLPALIWLEYFLKDRKMPFIVVSHDTIFLDRVTNKVFEIDWHDHTLSVMNAKYSDFLLQKERLTKRQLLDHTQQKEEIGRLKGIAKQKQADAIAGSEWVSPDNDKMLQGFKRNRAGKSFHEAKVTYNRIKRIDVVDKPNERKHLLIDINAHGDGKSRDIILRDVMCGYKDDFTIGPLSLAIPFGTRICLLGMNGVGKTTILKTITGTISPLSGERIVEDGVYFGNLMQEHESLPKKETVIGFLSKRVDEDRDILQNHLTHFGFSPEQSKRSISTLSPGGRTRLLLALFAVTHVNVLVLDEPTNHLDREAQAALDTALSKFEGTLITVTHDRSLVEKTQFDMIYHVTETGLEMLDDFASYVAQMEQRSKKLLRLLGK